MTTGYRQTSINKFNIQDYLSEYTQNNGITIQVLVDYIDIPYLNSCPVMYLVGEDWMAHCSGCAERKIEQIRTAIINWSSGSICQECGDVLSSYNQRLSPRF
jgi:hypothetical protein